MKDQSATGGAAGQSRARRARQATTASVVQLLARRTPYLESEMLGLADVVRPGAVCVDVGASAGLYSVMLAELAGPQGRVLSIEPVSFGHPAWTRLLGVASLPNVQAYSMALGSQPGRGVMSVPVGRHGPVTGRSYLDWKTSGPGSNAEFRGRMDVDIEVQTLDGLFASAGLTQLDFIKIDVEGGEMHVLEGGKQVIEKFRPALLVEIEDRHTARYDIGAEDVTGWLTSRGYSMHAWQDGWKPAPSVCMHTRNYLFRPGVRQPDSQAAARIAPGAPRAPLDDVDLDASSRQGR